MLKFRNLIVCKYFTFIQLPINYLTSAKNIEPLSMTPRYYVLSHYDSMFESKKSCPQDKNDKKKGNNSQGSDGGKQLLNGMPNQN